MDKTILMLRIVALTVFHGAAACYLILILLMIADKIKKWARKGGARRFRARLRKRKGANRVE